MKKIKNILSLTLLSTLIFIGCNSDDLTNRSNIVAAEGVVATVNFGFENNVNALEVDEPVLTYTISLNKPQVSDVKVYVSVTGGTATLEDDYSYDTEVVIAANTTSATGTISIVKDAIYEVTENLTIKIGDNRTANATLVPVERTINIINYVSNDLEATLDWSGTFTSGGESVDFCELDMDLEVYNDTDPAPINTSYSSCPEHVTFSADLPDGSYFLICSIYSTVGYSEMVNIPASMTFSKNGSNFSETFDISSFFPMQDGGFEEGNPNYYYFYTVVKSGTTYTILDQDSNQIAQGRKANIINNFKKNSAAKRALKIKK